MRVDNQSNPTHLFINYAIEDVILAKWLARKLASLGYAIWFDQMKMLGGEPWPQTIDDAIKNRTFRMLALMSANSVSKPNPTKERTRALKIGQQRGISDFVITLKVDTADLDWQTTDISYVPFNRGWADGLKQLLKKLDSISAPRTLTSPSSIAAATFPTGEDLISEGTEEIRANVIRIKEVPVALSVFEATSPLDDAVVGNLRTRWASYVINDSTFFAFHPPPEDLQDTIKTKGEQWAWADCERIHGIRSRDVVAHLIVRTLHVRLLSARCLMHPTKFGTFFLPEDFTNDGWVRFVDHKLANRRVKIRGRATFRRAGKPPEVNYHHFAFRLKLGRGLDKFFWVQVTPTLFFFDESGAPITDDRVGPRRRRMTKQWWNDKWLYRLLAAEQILLKLQTDARDGLVLDDGLLRLESPVVLNEAALGETEETAVAVEEAGEYDLPPQDGDGDEAPDE